MLQLCANDLGFGWNKAKSNGRIYIQPSIVGEAKPLFEESFKEEDMIFNDEHFVGNLALRHSDIKFFSMNDNKSKTWISEVLLKSAIGYLCGSNECNVVTGLPYKYFFAQRDSLRRKILELDGSKTYKIKYGHSNTYTCSPRVGDCHVVAQGHGIAMDYLLDDNGKLVRKDEAKGSILVIDLGFYTLNLLSLDKLEITKESDTLLLGVENAYKLLQRYLQEHIGKSPARYELDPYVISGKYEGVNIQPLIQKAFKLLATQIKNEIDSLNRHYDHYLIGGGASHLIAPYLDLPNKVVLDQLSQIRGYEKTGVRKWHMR